jgi:hypothetical protein
VNIPVKTLRATAILLTLFSGSFLSGCNRQHVELVPIAGKVTLEGAVWDVPGMIVFTPVDAQGKVARVDEHGELSRHVGIGYFSSNGNFMSVRSEMGSGLCPGTYRVTVVCTEQDPQGRMVDHVPQRYQNPETSNLELTLAPGTPPQMVRFDLERMKPAEPKAADPAEPRQAAPVERK